MRILVLGGTQFVGRHFVEAALAAGHQATLFHRGKTGAGLFPECEHVLGDRLESLAPLDSQTWDALVDVSAYVPRAVKIAAESLAHRVGYTLQVSTISVYHEEAKSIDEQSPHAVLPDPTVEEITGETYGSLKSLCEKEGAAGFPNIGFVRPTYVVGPHDHTKRFTTWVDRLGRNKDILCPARPDSAVIPLQVIDARDLAEFMLQMVETQATGAYNACCDPLDFRDVLARIKATLGSTSTISWTEEAVEAVMFPPSDGSDDSFMTVSNQKAKSAGLTFRPLEETARDIWSWWEPQNIEL